MKLENGQSIGVEVAGDPRTMAAAIVVRVNTPDDLPELGGESPDPKLAGKLLAEAGVRSIAWISYFTAGGHEVVLAVLEGADGNWRDLRGQELRIWPLGACAIA